MTTKPPKRKASAADREAAAELARRYRERDPYRVEINGRTVERFVDGDELEKALDAFAERGTFAAPGLPLPERATILKEGYRRLLARGFDQLDALAALVEAHGVGEQTVRDAIYGRMRRPAKRKKGAASM
jgi:hypothetical protein